MRTVSYLCAAVVYLVLAASCGGVSHDPTDAGGVALVEGGEAVRRDGPNVDTSVGNTPARDGRTDERDGRADERDGRTDEREDTRDGASDLADGGLPGVDSEAVLLDASAAAVPSDAAAGDARVASLTVTPSRSTVERGAAIRFVSRARYADGSEADVSTIVSLASSDPAVVQITGEDDGLGGGGSGWARSPGIAVITATLNGVAATAMVTVTEIEGIVSIAVTVVRNLPPLDDEDCFVNNTARFRATATLSSGQTRDVAAHAVWASARPNIIVFPTVGSTAHCLSAGQVVISATVGGVRGETTATVRGDSVVGYVLTGPAVLSPGSSARYRVVALYEDGRLSNLGVPAAVLSSDPKVVSLTPYDGRLQNPSTGAEALATGSAVLSASFQGVQVPSLKVTVTSAALQSIALTPGTLELLLPAFGRLAVTGTYADGTEADLSTTATWSDSALLSVVDGVVLAWGTGEGSVTASVGAITSAPSVITVRAAPPSRIEVRDIGVREGFTRSLSAVAYYREYRDYALGDGVTWTVGDASQATVVGSTVFGRSAGTTFYSATFAGVRSEPKVLHVVAPAALLSIEFSEPDLHHDPGGTTWMRVHGVFAADGPNGDVDDITGDAVFTIGNPQVATVSNDAATRGMVRAVGIGTTSLTAIVHGVTATTTITVGPALP